MSNRIVSSIVLASLGVVAPGCPSQLSDASHEGLRQKPKAATQGSKADAKAEIKAEAKAPPHEAPANAAQDTKAEVHRRFRKGQMAPPGMTPEEIVAYSEAQGDPAGGAFSLDQALAGDATLGDRAKGKLIATFETTAGKFDCELYEDKAPKTVANFVGLARGTRPSLDSKTDTWTNPKFYEGIIFHRVIAGFMIQTGDPTGTGRGGPGFVIEDEFGEGLLHRGPGLLSMANRGKNTGSSQFFITVADTPHLDGKHAIFGKCDPEIPLKISQVEVDPRQGDRPVETISIQKIDFTRK